MAIAATLNSERNGVNSNSPWTLEEKRIFQTERLTALNALLASELPTIEQQLRQGGEFRGDEGFDEAYFRRWLRARYWDVDSAAQSIREHAAWRVAYCRYQGRIHVDQIANELATGKICLQGVDHKGRALIIARAALHSLFVRDADEVERLLCYAIDRQLDIADSTLNPNRKTCVLFDLTDIGMMSLDVTVMHQVYTMLSHHFVERLGKLFIFNAPMIFWATWKGFSTIIPKESLEKIEFNYPTDLASLHEEVPLEILPEAYGGKAEFIPIQNFH